MPTLPTLLDAVKANNTDKQVGLVEEAFRATPETLLIPTRTIKGHDFRTFVRTGLPTVAFRHGNEGLAASASTWENRQTQCAIIQSRWECDKVVATAYDGGHEQYCILEADGALRASFITMARQCYYGVGTGGDAKGFPGLLSQVDSSMVVDAGGTTDNTGSSVWALRFGLKDLQFVIGGNGRLAMSKPTECRLKDSNNNIYHGYSQELVGWVGLQVASTYSAGRIKCLTTDSGKGLTDDLIADLVSRFKEGYEPHALIMTRRSRLQLQKSRTSSGAWSSTPTESNGIPIYTSPALLNTESLAL